MTFLNELDWNKTFYNIKKKSEIKLKWLQIRIIHRVIGTNVMVKKMKIVPNDQCSLCNIKVENIPHVFWKCQFVQQFWVDFERFLGEKCMHIENLKMNEELVILGNSTYIKLDDVLYFIILFAKHFLYKCRLENTRPAFCRFLKCLEDRFKIEEHT